MTTEYHVALRKGAGRDGKWSCKKVKGQLPPRPSRVGVLYLLFRYMRPEGPAIRAMAAGFYRVSISAPDQHSRS